MNPPLRGTIRVVSDKSLTHRGVLLAALARGRTELREPNEGADCRATLRAAEMLGATVRREPGKWILDPPSGGLVEPEDVLDLGNSGTGMRLLSGVLAWQPFLSVLTGDRSLRGRPMGRAVEALRSMGASIDARQGGRAPLVIRGGALRGIAYRSPLPSAQIKSAVLLAGLGLSEGAVRLEEPARSRDHTERLLRWLGAPLSEDGEAIVLGSGARLEARDWTVPGDISAAVFFIVAGAITPGSDLTVEGVGLNPTRTGALEALLRMGARLETEVEATAGPEPVGRLRVRHGPLRPLTVGGPEVPRLIDEIPVLAVAAAMAEGVSRFDDVGDLRNKESDRILATCAMLGALGVETEEHPGGFTVHGRGRLSGGRVEGRDDHRICMAARVAGCAASEEVRVDREEMVSTSDPMFFETLARLRRGGAGNRP